MGSHSNLSTSESSSRPLTPLPAYRPASCPAPTAPTPTRITANGPLSPARGPTVAASHVVAVGRGYGLQVMVDAQEFTPETPALTLGNSSSSPSHEGLASGSEHESGDDGAAASCVDSATSIPEPVAQVLQQAQYLRKHRRNRRKPMVQRLSGPAVTANPPAPAVAPTPSRIVQQHQHQQAPRRRILLTSEQQNIWIAKGRCTYNPVGTCAEETINGSAFCAIHSCRARNADGELCLNLVVDPAQSRYCHTGYHTETERHHHVTALVRRHQEHNFLEAKARQEDFENGVAFFDANFLSSGASSRASTSPSQSFIGLSDLGGQYHTAPTTPTRSHAQLEPRWGAHNDDKWWVGEWTLRSTYATAHNTPH
ncbi:uncharacterized protein LOC62_01G000681 [Vanrija pseudolonga]|uniref:SCA7 domain-containing protein n=1 Tax=Vanrija pseudolonga TaxID=143232 RepID=A0AAF0Y0S2_9TREE|nr:hypothetical protein LOC62_01G000681 [Vanrija pseudolonga]